jgi:hypothetical protein
MTDHTMSSLTAALYGALVVYLGGWFFGFWTGNFSLLLFILTVATLAFWLAERFHFAPAREAAAVQLESQDAARRAGLAVRGLPRRTLRGDDPETCSKEDAAAPRRRTRGRAPHHARQQRRSGGGGSGCAGRRLFRHVVPALEGGEQRHAKQRRAHAQHCGGDERRRTRANSRHETRTRG